MRILLLDPPKTIDGRSAYQEECCIGFSSKSAWTSKTSFLAESYKKQGHYVSHIDMRFRPIPDDWHNNYDVARVLLSKATVRLLKPVLQELDPDQKHNAKIEILAAMLEENDTLKALANAASGREFNVIDSRIPDGLHAPLGGSCSPVSARLCDNFFYAVSSGCSYGCLHCPWGHHKEIWRPADIVVQDLIWLRDINKRKEWRTGLGSIYLECAQINSNPDWLDKFAELKGEAGLHTTWSTDMNVLGLNKGIIDLLAISGCKRAVIGFEALDDGALSIIGKKHKVDDILKATELLAGKPIGISAHFLCGYGETADMIDRGIMNLEKIHKQGFRPARVKFGRVAHYDQVGFRVVDEIPKDVLRAHTRMLKAMESYGWPITYFRFKRTD